MSNLPDFKCHIQDGCIARTHCVQLGYCKEDNQTRPFVPYANDSGPPASVVVVDTSNWPVDSDGFRYPPRKSEGVYLPNAGISGPMEIAQSVSQAPGTEGWINAGLPGQKPLTSAREIIWTTELKSLYETNVAKAFPGADKPSNPKDAVGSDKLPLHLWPATATAAGCIGLLNGMLKYGRNNFRAVGIRASIYSDGAERHLKAWIEGEEVDPEDGIPHLWAALANIAIIIDADAAGKLNDDRNVTGGYRKFIEKLTPHVARLKALHKERNPKHYTIKDNEQ